MWTYFILFFYDYCSPADELEFSVVFEGNKTLSEPQLIDIINGNAQETVEGIDIVWSGDLYLMPDSAEADMWKVNLTDYITPAPGEWL